MEKKLAAPIAFGRTAEIYAWDEGKVIKLYYDWFSREAVGMTRGARPV